MELRAIWFVSRNFIGSHGDLSEEIEILQAKQKEKVVCFHFLGNYYQLCHVRIPDFFRAIYYDYQNDFGKNGVGRS